MKRIIEGKRYDTESAEEVASDGYGHAGDFHHWRETLYRTPNGAWFMVGTGGPLSKYGEETGQNERSGGTHLFPMTAVDAKSWCEEHEATTALEYYFTAEIVDA